MITGDAFINTDPTETAGVSGTLEQGSTISARLDDLKDVDGIDPLNFQYQWLRDGADIAGATSDSYDVVALDVATEISVEITYLDGAGTQETVLSSSVLIS